MIQKVHIENYKCLRDVDVALGPLTVLVGANASGKTAMLEALRLAVADHRSVWRRQKGLDAKVAFVPDSGKTIEWTRARQGQPPPVEIQFLRLKLDALRHDNQVQREQRLAANGGNLTNVFFSLDRQAQGELAVELMRMVPQYRDVRAQPSAPGNLHLEFQDRWQDDLWYLPYEVSDGTILTLAFLILRYQSPAPELLLIEEPERGLHPFLLEQLVALVRGLSTGAFGGPPIQVVMATHSAELLEHLEPEEVRFLKRAAKDGSTQVEKAPTDDPDWARAYAEYQHSLGTAWLSGGLGGVPGVG